MNILQISKTSIFHPFLFAIFPIIHLYSINFIEVPIDDIIFPMFVSVLVAGSLLLLSRVILKDWTKSSFIVSLLLVLSFSYGHIYNLLDTVMLGEFEIGRHRYLLSIFLVMFIVGTTLVIRTHAKLDNLKKIINGIAITLIVITVPNFAFSEIPILETNLSLKHPAGCSFPVFAFPLNPCFFNRYAETDESTPPDIPTTTVLLDIFIFLLSIKIIFIRSIICNTKFVKY